MVKSWSKEQAHIAFSSGEAELYAANYGAAQGKGLQSIMADLGWECGLAIQVDANATIGMLHRQGLGNFVTFTFKIYDCSPR